MLTFAEVVNGPIDDDTHAGKMLVYLNKLLELNPGRGHVYGALTNLEHAVVYRCVRGGKIGYCQPVPMEKGTCTGRLLLHALWCILPKRLVVLHVCISVKMQIFTVSMALPTKVTCKCVSSKY